MGNLCFFEGSFKGLEGSIRGYKGLGSGVLGRVWGCWVSGFGFRF